MSFSTLQATQNFFDSKLKILCESHRDAILSISFSCSLSTADTGCQMHDVMREEALLVLPTSAGALLQASFELSRATASLCHQKLLLQEEKTESKMQDRRMLLQEGGNSLSEESTVWNQVHLLDLLSESEMRKAKALQVSLLS